MIKKNNFEINVRDFESISCEISNKKTSKKTSFVEEQFSTKLVKF